MRSVSQELPAATDRRRDGAHRLEPSRLGVEPRRHELALQPDPLLRRRRARAVCVVLVLADLLEVRVGVTDHVVRKQFRGPVLEQRDAVDDGHVERIDVVRRHPRDVAVGRFRRELDAFGDNGSGRAGDLDGLVDETCGRVGGRARRRRRSPRRRHARLARRARARRRRGSSPAARRAARYRRCGSARPARRRAPSRVRARGKVQHRPTHQAAAQ